MADSDSDGNEPQMPKKTKLELTVKEKEERYMAAAHISPQFDTMVGFFFDQDPRSGAMDGAWRGSARLCVCVRGTWRFGSFPALRTAVGGQGRR